MILLFASGLDPGFMVYFDHVPLWMKGTSSRFQQRVQKRALEMNQKTRVTFLYQQHVPLQQVPESSKNKASKSDKKPEEEPETQEEESGTQPWPETQPEHRGEAILAVLQDLEDVFKWNLETESA